MRKLILLILALIGMTQAHAYDYGYLVFQKSDGTQVAFDVNALEITVEGETLAVTNSVTSESLDINTLVSMCFSKDNTTAIKDVQETSGRETVEVYSATGVFLGTYPSAEMARNAVSHGVFVFKMKGSTVKFVRK